MSDGIEKLRLLLSGITAPPANPVNLSFPANSFVIPNLSGLQYQVQPQQQASKPPLFDENQFQNKHLERVEFVKKLSKEQDTYVDSILKRFEGLNQELTSLKGQFETLGMIKKTSSEIVEKRQEIKSQMQKLRTEILKETKKVQEKMIQFQR
jgi:hypothetical protein